MSYSQLNKISKGTQDDFNNEAPVLQKQSQEQINQTDINAQVDKNSEYDYDYENENENEISTSNQITSNKFNDTEELLNLEKKNANLITEKMRFQQNLIASIGQLLNEQNQLRAQLNLPPNDQIENQTNLNQYTLDQLEEYRQKIQEFNKSLIKKINMAKSGNNDNNVRSMNTSDVLKQERNRNKNLKRELKKLKESQNQNSNNGNEDVNNAINELQQENQKLSREMIKVKNQRHRSHNQEVSNQVDNQKKSQRDFNSNNSDTNAINELQQENQRLNRELLKAKNRRPRYQIQEVPSQVSNKRRNQSSNNSSNSSDITNQRPPDPNKIHLAEQLMAENALLRNTLGLDPLNYHPVENFSMADIDKIIAQLLDHNKIMRDQVDQQSRAKNGMGYLKRPIQTQQMARYLQYLDLQGSREGCTFWVPLDAKKQKEQQDYYNDMQMRLPIAVETDADKKRKKKFKGCSKCEKAILMMSRVPLYPPDASKIIEGSDEFQLVESWIITSLNRKVKLTDVMKSSFFYRIIENERTMHNIHLYVITTDDPMQYLVDGIDQPILLADHFKYVEKELRNSASAQVLICAFDPGNQATNFCEHTIIPNIQEMKSANPSFDSLKFTYQKEEAVMALDPSRVVPIYAVRIGEID